LAAVEVMFTRGGGTRVRGLMKNQMWLGEGGHMRAKNNRNKGEGGPDPPAR